MVSRDYVLPTQSRSNLVSNRPPLDELLVSRHRRSIFWWLRTAGFVLPCGVVEGGHLPEREVISRERQFEV